MQGEHDRAEDGQRHRHVEHANGANADPVAGSRVEHGQEAEGAEELQVMVPVFAGPAGSRVDLTAEEEQTDRSMEAEDGKVLLVVQSDAGSDEEAVMVVSQNTRVAQGAVVGQISLVDFTFLAVVAVGDPRILGARISVGCPEDDEPVGDDLGVSENGEQDSEEFVLSQPDDVTGRDHVGNDVN